MKKGKGITLIALVITIIVMLILVAVTLSISLGDNGILKKAREANENQEKAQEQEILQDLASAAFNEENMKVNYDDIELPEGWRESIGTYTSPNGNVFYVLETSAVVDEDSDEICTLTFDVYQDDGEDIAELDVYTYKIPKGSTIYFTNDYITYLDETINSATVTNSNYYVRGWYIDGYDEYVYEDESYQVNKDITITYTGSYSCVAKGTKITMADGTLKNVEDIKVNDKVLSYNYYTGRIEPETVTTILAGYSEARIFNVTLENGTLLKIVDYELLFDTDERIFIPINIYTYQDSVGKNVMINNNGNIASSKIVSIILEEGEIEHYTMYTTTSVDYIANGIIALAPIYYVNLRYTIGEDFKVDEEIYNADVEKYGLYTYEDLKDVCTEKTFNEYSLKDYKPVIEKGIMSFEKFKIGIKQLQDEIDAYSELN